MSQSLRECIEYRQRLKGFSSFQYSPPKHSRTDILEEDYFHNSARGFFEPGDEIHVGLRHADGSWSKGVFEVISMTEKHTVVEQIVKWRSGGGTRVDKPKPKAVEAAA